MQLISLQRSTTIPQPLVTRCLLKVTHARLHSTVAISFTTQKVISYFWAALEHSM